MVDHLVETSFLIKKALLDEAGALAKRLNLTPGQFFAAALENFIRDYQRQGAAAVPPAPSPSAAELPPAAQPHPGRRDFKQGDLYWIALEEPGVSHPHVIIQDDVFNRSRIHTVVVCALTTNLTRARWPGSVLLDAGEGGLPRQSVVEASKVSAVYKRQFGEYIGSLSPERVAQVLAGMRFLQALMENRKTRT